MDGVLVKGQQTEGGPGLLSGQIPRKARPVLLGPELTAPSPGNGPRGVGHPPFCIWGAAVKAARTPKDEWVGDTRCERK